jgi:hypothetical protein
MHPVLERYYRRHPRSYGTAMLLGATVLSLFWRRSVPCTFFLVMFSIGYGVGGVLLLILGARCHAWDAWGHKILDGDRMSAWEILAAVAVGAGVLVASVVVWLALPLGNH